MLNNRQASRRRGRGGQRQPNTGRENGNRIDNRARGNAPQMLEKYKTLARDSQMSGDRVMTEYYLQFADHYFRVVAETRARFEETRRPRDDWQGDDGYDGDDQSSAESDDGDGDTDDDRASPAFQPSYPERDDRPRDERPRDDRARDNRPRDDRSRDDSARDDRPREDRPREDRPRETRPRNDRANGDQSRADTQRPDMQRSDARRDDRPRQPRNGTRPPPRARDEDAASETEGTIDIAVLPPAFGSDSFVSTAAISTEDDASEAPAPRRRGRPKRVIEPSSDTSES